MSGIAALGSAPKLFARSPAQLAESMAALHAIDPEPTTTAIRLAAPEVAWSIDEPLDHVEAGAHALERNDLVGVIIALRKRYVPGVNTVSCHGDLHPFNLLVQGDGSITVVDWTSAILAAPAFDVAFTSMLLANPPLDASGPIGVVIGFAGRRLAKRFVSAYRDAAQQDDLTNIDWYQALHSTRLLLEVASLEARDAEGAQRHPYNARASAARAAIVAATGITPSIS